MFLALLCAHVLLFTTPETIANKQNEVKDDDGASNKFAVLLKNIVSINERRFKAMKELARLQEYSVTKYNLRSGKEYFDKEKKHRRPIIIVIFAGHGRNHRTRLNHIKPVWIKEDQKLYKTDPHVDLGLRNSYVSRVTEDGVVPAISRSRWHSGCSKKMAKYCKKACANAYKNVCRTFDCKKRMKRIFRRECKRSCKGQFSKDKYSSDDEDVVYEYPYSKHHHYYDYFNK